MQKHHLLFGLIISVALFISSCEIPPDIVLENLTCEYLENPTGIDVVQPRLSWMINTSTDDFTQNAYHIMVASSPENLEKDLGDLWNSGTIFSSQSSLITYEGKPLTSRKKAYWKVRILDKDDKVTQWSDINSWEMGLLEPSDWHARWTGREDLRPATPGQKNPAIYFRKSFMLNDSTTRARAYVTGLGYYEMYINGKKVGDHVLSPNQTNYDRRQVNSYYNGKIANMSSRVLYETYDIADYLKQGENAVAIVLGNGWYYQTDTEEYLPLFFDTPRFIAQLKLYNKDGKTTTIASDSTWRNSHGPILDNDLHHGEIYDARLEQAGWNDAPFDDAAWQLSSEVRPPEGVLKAQMSPPDRVVKSLRPVELSIPRKNIYRYDFGTMFSGWVKLTIQGPAGSVIHMSFQEDNGNPYQQADTYILKGGGLETWEPRFTWHAFRYVEVESLDIVLTVDNVQGRVVNTDVTPAGRFGCSNELFNRINEDFTKTQQGNMHGGVPSDCPHRERRGYTGDGQIAAQAAIYNFNMQAFYTKWLHDIADAQNSVTGYVPNTVPYHDGGGGTPWGSAYIIIPWYMYLYYGDSAILQEHYRGMKKYAAYLESQTDGDGLIVEDNLGEWVPPTKTEIPPSYVSSAYYYYDLTLLTRMAAVLGEDSDSMTYTELAEKVKVGFNQRYYHPETGNYSIGRQGANVFALAFNLVPEQNVDAVFGALVNNIVKEAKGHFDTGMMATPYLLEVLTRYGRADLAYTVMNRRDFPSYGYNIERGATSLWETWTGNDSHSHPMFGSVCAWFYQSLAGINPDGSNPGFRHIIVKPYVVSELSHVNTTYPTAYGPVGSYWELVDGNLKLTVEVPPNTTATVFVPGNNVNSLDRKLQTVIIKEHNQEWSVYEVGSGDYSFVSTGLESTLLTPMLDIPVIEPAKTTYFSPDSVTVNIRQSSKNARIMYTIDGTEPSETSTPFTQPFTLRKSTTVKARVFRQGSEPGYPSSRNIVFIDSLKNGLQYEYYLGAWDELPDFSRITPAKSGKVYDADLKEFAYLDEQFAIVFSGSLNIAKAGLYTFTLESNDGSRLFLDGKLVADSDGKHTFADVNGRVNLSAGMHKLRLEYFQAGGGKGLELYYQGEGMDKQRIPADLFFTDKSQDK